MVIQRNTVPALFGGSLFDSPALRRFLQFEEFEVSKYPPVNVDIVKPRDEESEPFYKLTMAVAGFAKKDLTIRCDGSIVKISGERPDEKEVSDEYEFVETRLNQLASRSFERAFTFGSVPVEVRNAKCKDGILTADIHLIKPPEGNLIPIK